jgi:streptogramin lyase
MTGGGLMRAHHSIRRVAVVAGIVVAAAGIAVVPDAARTTAASVSPPTTCTAAEQAAALAALHKFEAAMPARRRRFFRKHKSKAARRRFLRAQRAKLKKLEAAANCTLIPPGASILSTIPVPNDGPVALGLGSVWVEDREGGTSSAQLFRIDPQTEGVTDKVPNVLGGAATVMNGSVWVASFGTNRLLRIDPTTDTVTSYATGPSVDEGPQDVLPVAGQLWVSNHHGGTVALINPQDGTISSAIQVAPVGPSGPQDLATDGSSVWVGIPGDNTIDRISIANHTVTPLAPPPYVPCGGLAADSTALWATGAGCGSGGVTRYNPTTNQISASFNTPGHAFDVTIAFGSIWVITSDPNELVRIDPATNQITGRLPLPATPWVPHGIAADTNSLWVRVGGYLLHVTPQP